jgi:hypothetical protein
MKSIYVSPTNGPEVDFHGASCDANVLFGGVLLVVCSETEQKAWAPGAWHSFRITEEGDIS